MIVEGNGFTYALENRLIKKLDIMIDRVTRKKPKLDAWLSVEGSEGSGKSNTACAVAYYVKQKTNFEVHLFFRLEALIRFAQSNENKIIIWDEPALDSLSTDQLKKINRDLLRLAMTIRKKRHFFIINFTKFYKFSEYIVVDRCLGMVHMYSKNEINIGRFRYIKKSNLEPLWNDYAKSKKRNYRRLCAFRGGFPDIMQDHLDKMDFWIEGVPHATYKDYEKHKDRSINSIGKVEVEIKPKFTKIEEDFRQFKYLLSQIDVRKLKCKEDLAKALKINIRTLQRWSGVDENVSFSLEKSGLEGFEGGDNISNRDKEEKFLDDPIKVEPITLKKPNI